MFVVVQAFCDSRNACGVDRNADYAVVVRISIFCFRLMFHEFHVHNSCVRFKEIRVDPLIFCPCGSGSHAASINQSTCNLKTPSTSPKIKLIQSHLSVLVIS